VNHPASSSGVAWWVIGECSSGVTGRVVCRSFVRLP
jgi:hypothetical protein